MKLQLSDVTSLRLRDNAGQLVVLPNPQLVSNLPLMVGFLQQVVDDWDRSCAPSQEAIALEARTCGDQMPPTALRAFSDLQPTFLKCLFSYTFFLVACERAFERVYREINLANHLSGRHVKHARMPQETPYMSKARQVRNLGIAHVGSKDNASLTESAAMSWQPLIISRQEGGLWQINRITFAGFRFERKYPDGNVEYSEDISIEGIADLHEDSTRYFQECDRVCVEYLRSLHEAMRPPSSSPPAPAPS